MIDKHIHHFINVGGCAPTYFKEYEWSYTLRCRCGEEAELFVKNVEDYGKPKEIGFWLKDREEYIRNYKHENSQRIHSHD